MKFISYCFKKFSPVVSKFLVITGLSLSFVSCQWGDEVVSLVQTNPDDFTAAFSDTTTVNLSTVAPDSVMTGSSMRVLFGRFADPYLGKMHSSSFFQPGLSNPVTIAETAVYDSLILSLRYDGYYYGDTTKLMNLSVYRLTEDLTLKSPVYNGNSTPYDPTPIGTIKFYPRPSAGSRATSVRQDLKIKLSGELGKRIFDLAKANSITTQVEWINLLKGVAIIPGASDDGSVVGFQVKNASTSLQLHYHSPATIEGVLKDSTIFTLSALYNQLLGDRSQTALSKLKGGIRFGIPSAQTGNMSFIQAGTGIMTRVDFPSVRQLKYTKFTFANKAFLRIEPLRQSVTNVFKAPDTLHIYLCDRNNEYIRSSGFPVPLTDLSQRSQVLGILRNDLVNNKQYYSIDVSQYVSTILRSESEENYGLILRTSDFDGRRRDSSFPDLDTEFSKRMNRLVIGDQSNPNGNIKLELYYTTVKIE